MWEPSTRYPDPAVQVLDASFNQYRLPLASVKRLYTGCRWSEGPVYVADGRYLLWSDIPNDRIPARLDWVRFSLNRPAVFLDTVTPDSTLT